MASEKLRLFEFLRQKATIVILARKFKNLKKNIETFLVIFKHCDEEGRHYTYSLSLKLVNTNPSSWNALTQLKQKIIDAKAPQALNYFA